MISTVNEVRPSEHGGAGASFPTAQNACLTGRCTGLLSAVAVSCSHSRLDLLWLGLHTVAVAFRVGAVAWDVGSRLCACHDDSGRYQPWTAAVAGASVDDIREAIHLLATKKVPLSLWNESTSSLDDVGFISRANFGIILISCFPYLC
jgi:hypothetical protein